MLNNADPRPRILILTDNLSAGGMERQVIELLKGLKRNGKYWAALGAIDQGGSRENEAKKFAESYLPLPRKWRYDVTPIFTLIRLSKLQNINLIHAYGWMSAAAGLVTAKWLRIPIINGSIREAPMGLGFHPHITRWCALFSNAIVANSRAGLESYHLSNHPRARVIYNGVDFNRFSSTPQKNPADRSICMVANFGPHKDHKTVIEAFSLLKHRYPETRLVLVGHDLGTLKSSQMLVSSLGLDCVEFVTDTIHPEPIIAESEICVLTSLYGEGISNSILEYQFLTKPVIATNSGGNPELIVDGKTGILVPKQSPEALVEAVIELMDHPDRARQLGEAGHQYVQQHFGLDRMVREYEDLYGSLLSA